MPLNLSPSMRRSLMHAAGGTAAGAALGGLTADPEHRMRGALQGGAIGGIAAGGASALANHSAGQRINGLKGDVAAQAAAHAATTNEFQGLQQQYGLLNANHEQAQMALRGASRVNGDLNAQISGLNGKITAADTRIARLLKEPSNMAPVSGVPITPAPPQPRPAYAPTQPQQANAVVDRALQAANSSTPPVSHVTPVPARPAVTPPPPAPFQPWASGPMQAQKVAMGPLGGAMAGAVTGGIISGGASALSGERDPANLARNAGLGAVVGGGAGYGIASSAGGSGYASGHTAGYERRKAFEPQIDALTQQALSPLDVLRGMT